jgi:electron transfer flavoprotein alpha subunit
MHARYNIPIMAREIWSFIEVDDGQLDETACKMAFEARRTADLFHAESCGVVFAPAGHASLNALHHYGLKKLYLFDTPDRLAPESIAREICKVASSINPVFILFAHTAGGSEIGSRVAASLKRGFITRCVDFVSTAERPVVRKVAYGEKVHLHMTWETPPPYLATVELTSLEDVKARVKHDPVIIMHQAEKTGGRVRLVRKWQIDGSSLDFSEANLVIGVGKGMSSEGMEAVTHLAALVNGVVGGTRMAVHSRLIPREKLIGTTGKWLDCDLYLALGISGAPQHVMGIQGAREIIAVNRVREAPIFRHATLGIVADVSALVPRLIQLMESRGKQTT